MDTKARSIYCHNMKKNGVRGEIWRHDKFHIPWKTKRWDTWLYGFKIM